MHWHLKWSKFQAFTAKINSKSDAFKVIAKITTSEKYFKDANHYYSAYNYDKQFIDTHEDTGSKAIAEVMKKSQIKNYVVVVSKSFWW